MKLVSYFQPQPQGYKLTGGLHFFWSFYYKLTENYRFVVKNLVNWVFTQFTKILDHNFKTRLIFQNLAKKKRNIFDNKAGFGIFVTILTPRSSNELKGSVLTG